MRSLDELLSEPRPTWEAYAMDLAWVASSRSQDPYVKVGAVVLRRDRSVASTGYNGPPPGVEIDWSDRASRRMLIIHAETNALRYTMPNQVRGGLLAVTHHPCMSCLPAIAAFGLDVVYSVELDPETYPPQDLATIVDGLGIKVRKVQGSGR